MADGRRDLLRADAGELDADGRDGVGERDVRVDDAGDFTGRGNADGERDLHAADTTSYYTVTGSASVTVNKATLTVTASSTSVSYGSAVPAIAPSYSGWVNGDTSSSLTTAPGCTTVYTATSPVSGSPYATSCSGGVSSNYTFNYVAGTVTVAKATPSVSAWPAASAIGYGQTLASSTLTGGTASVSGTFAWTAPATTPGVGASSQSVTFTPADGTDYNTVTGTASVTVNKATPSVLAWPAASAINYGQTLADSSLTGGTASVSGTFAWTTPATTPSAGTSSQSVTFTPSDGTDYNTVTGSVSVTVNSAPAPAVTSTSPANGATNVNIGNTITATFSLAMDSSTITSSTFTLATSGGTAVSGLVSYVGGTATFTPNTALAYSTSYTATITTAAKSSAEAPLASNYVWTFTTGANPNAVTVDFGTTFQTIRGFGGSTAWLGQLTAAQATALFNQTSGLGLSILRVRIDPTGSASSSPAYVTSNWTQELTNAQEAIAANSNAIVFASPWTPPVSMKSNNNTVEGTLNTGSYGAYASYLEDFAQYFSSNGAPLYAISMQNEPDATVTYESCAWTPAQMDAWVASLTASGATDPLTTKLMMPESQNFLASYSDPTLNDANAVGNVAIVAGHLYGVSPSYATNAESKGKDVWMTEWYPMGQTPASGAQPAIADALIAAKSVHNSMVTGQYNAYVWWWIWNDDCDSVNYGLITDGLGQSGIGCGASAQPQPTYYGYAIGQFSKFVQPGFVRANATSNPVSGVYLSAYKGNGHYVIVAINSNAASSSLSFTIDNATVTSLTPYQTTASGGLAAQSAVTVSSGQFSYTLPAQSITTFYQ